MRETGTLLSMGSINLDFQVRAAGWPSESETVLGHDYLCAGGGKGANVALLAARLGVTAWLFGRVGDDALAGLALASLREANINLEEVRQLPHQATGTSMIVVRDDGDKTIVLAANANQRWEDEANERVSTWVRGAPDGSVLVTDLEVPLPAVRVALETARERGLITVLDPSPAEALTPALYASVDYLVPNPRETKHLTGVKVTGVKSAERAGRTLVDKGARTALVKLGDGGCVLVDAERCQHVSAPSVKVVDKTGAGDAFAGGLAVALLRGESAWSAARQAVLASTFAVTRYGSQAAYPAREELQRFADTSAR